MIPSYITRELRSGTSLEDCLVKYHTNLHEVMSGKLAEPKPKPTKTKQRKKKKRPKVCQTPAQYIQQIGDKFYLRKSVNGKLRTFGTYKSLEDAIKIRDHCKEHGWKQRSVDKYCEELGIKRCEPFYNSHVRYS